METEKDSLVAGSLGPTRTEREADCTDESHLLGMYSTFFADPDG